MNNNINDGLNNNEIPQFQNLTNNNMNEIPMSNQFPTASSQVSYSNYQQPVAQTIETNPVIEPAQGVSANLEQLASTLYNQMIEPISTSQESDNISQNQGMPAVALDVIETPGMSFSNLEVVEIPGMTSVNVEEPLEPKAPSQEENKVSSFENSVNTSSKSNKKGFFILLIFIVFVVIIGLVIYFLTTKGNEEKQLEVKPTEPIVEKDWDPSMSKIKIDSNAQQMICSMETEVDGTINKITYIHVYNNDEYIQVIVEDEMIFNEDTIRYYDYYVGSALEEIEYQSQLYDNIIIEVRQKKNAVSLAYSFDLTVSEENPKNMLDNKYMTMEDMKNSMYSMGFSCK